MDKPLNLYEKLHILAYETHEDDGGTASNIVRDPDMALVYHTMIRMRWAMVMCRNQFDTYVMIDEDHLGDTMTLVEQQALDERLKRHRGLVKTLDNLIRTTPELPASDWQDIATAPQNGKPVRLLGKRDDGSTYIETGAWANIQWSTELIRGHRPPTHWMHLEQLPEGYR